MSTTENVLNFGTQEQRHVYREFGGHMGIFVQPRSVPKMATPGLYNWNLGLHNRQWYNKIARHSGATTYYVRVVPIYGYWKDPDGLPLMGTPSTINATKGVTFDFEAFPDGYPCTGYRVYAGTTATTLYYQGEIDGRFNTHFVIGTTWPYNDASASLDAQTRGPAESADALEVYQVEGGTNSKVMLGGGKSYLTGYARVAPADLAPVLTCGEAGETTPASWPSDASWRMRLAWLESTLDFDSYFDFTGVDLSGQASMAAIAGVIQTTIRAARGPALFCGTGYEADFSNWLAFTAGIAGLYVDGEVVNIAACDFSGDNDMPDVAATIQAAWRVASGGSTETVTWDATATRMIFKTNPAAPTYANSISYLDRHTTAVGTDFSTFLDGRFDSSTAVLNLKGKAATTEAVAYSTDHFVITGSDTGDQYELSYLSKATANVGTDISVAGYMNGLSASGTATYVSGATAKRTVVGTGTAWGKWATKMRFRIQNESNETLVLEAKSTDHLLLDADYDGDALGSRALAYILEPFDSQIYPSALGNPFKWDSAIKLPTADSDKITAIKRLGRNFAIFMKHHTWIIDGVNITAPRQISQNYGAPNSDAVIEYGEGLAVYTGSDFFLLSGGSFTPLDPEGRIRELLSRSSVNTQHVHGQYLFDGRSEMCIWWFGLDSGWKYATAVCIDMKARNFWLYNHKDANCSAVIRDRNNKPYLVTGTTKDDGHSVGGFTFIHDFDYKNDGASWNSSKTKQGLIDTVGATTVTGGRIDCATYANTLANLVAVTEGYFSVTIDDNGYDVGPIDFSGAADEDAVAALIQTAIRTKTSGSETCTYEADHYRIVSGTTTNRSNISYLRAYIPNSSATSISGKSYLNGEDGYATLTGAVTQVVLTLDDVDGAVAALETDGDGETGCYLYICDTDGKSGQYALVAANDATTITVTPNFASTPVAGWHWFLGGIVPTWTKWFDWGAPQTRSKLHGTIITVAPGESASGNNMYVHGIQDLSTTVRTTKTIPLGGGQDSTNTINLSDKPANQHGISIKRPNSEQGLKIEDIGLVHAPRK